MTSALPLWKFILSKRKALRNFLTSIVKEFHIGSNFLIRMPSWCTTPVASTVLVVAPLRGVPEESLQKAQYGYRNDAWVALDECMSELDYLLGQGDGLEDRKDLKEALMALTRALEGYVGLASAEQRNAIQ